MQKRMESFFYTRVMEIFLEAARVCSFSKTAENLGITQSSVSQAIRKFEEHLGFLLFERDTRPLKLSKEGMVLYTRLIKERDETVRLINEIRSDNFLHPVMNIGMVETVAVAIAAPLCRRLRKYFSQVCLQCTSYHRLISDVEKGLVDLAIVASQEIRTELLHYELLYEEPWILLYPLNYYLPENPSWKDLEVCGLPHIFHEKHTVNGLICSKIFEQQRINCPKNFELDSMQLIYRFVEQGMGWSITQAMGVIGMQEYRSIRFIAPPSYIPKRRVYMVSRKDMEPHMRKQVVAAIKEEIRLAVITITSKVGWLHTEFAQRE